MATITEQLKWLVTADGTKAISTFENVGKSADKNLGAAEKNLDKLSAGFTKAGAGMIAGAGLLGGALVKAAGSFENLALTSSKFATQTGTTVQQASRLIEVTSDIGISSDTLATALTKMNKTLGATPAVFDKYGIAVARAKDGTEDVQQTFLNVVDGLNRIPDASTRAAASTAILGKGFGSLSQLLGESSAQIKASLAEVSDAHVISPAEADDAKKYQAALKGLHDSFEDLTLSIGKGAVPVLGEVAEVVSAGVEGFAKLDAITGGLVGQFAAISAVGLAAAGGLSLIVGAAIKVKSNLSDGASAVSNFAAKLGLKSAAEVEDVAATEAAAAADTAAVAATDALAASTAAAVAAAEAEVVAAAQEEAAVAAMSTSLDLAAVAEADRTAAAAAATVASEAAAVAAAIEAAALGEVATAAELAAVASGEEAAAEAAAASARQAAAAAAAEAAAAADTLAAANEASAASAANAGGVAGLGPAALVAGVAIGKVTDALDRNANAQKDLKAIKAFDSSLVDAFTKSVEAGTGAVGTLKDELQQSGGIKVRIDLEDKTRDFRDQSVKYSEEIDITPILTKNGVSLDQFGAAVEGGADKIAQLKDALKATGASSKDINAIITGATNSSKSYATALDKAAQVTELLSGQQAAANNNAAEGAGLLDGLSKSTDGYADAQAAANNNAAEGAGLLDGLSASTEDFAAESKTLADAQEHSTEVLAAHTKAQEADKQALDDARSAALAAIDAKYADRKATGDAADAVASYNQAQTDLTTATDKATAAHKKYGDQSKTTKKADQDATAAVKDFADKTDTAFDSVLNKAQADAKAAGAADGSAASVQGQIKSLGDQAAALAPGSPLRQRIEEYITDLGNIPKTINTNLHVSQTGDVSVNLGGGLSAHATGTASAKRGPTALGERGQEIVVGPDGAYIAGANGPEVRNLKGGERVYNAQQTAAILAGGAGTGPGNALPGYALGNVSSTDSISIVSAPNPGTVATTADTSAATSADDAVKEQDRIQAAMYETGRESLADYKTYVAGRLATSQDLSDDYLDQYRLLKQLNDQSASDAADAAKAADDQLTQQDDIEKNMHDLGVITDADYKAYLQSRLANFQAYTDGYTSVYKQIQQIDDDEAAAQKQKIADADAATKALYDQAQANKAASDAEAARQQGVNDVEVSGAAGERIQADRHSTADDRAQAVQDLTDKQNKLADDTYASVLAGATAANLDVGSVPWDRYVRAALSDYIGQYSGLGFSITSAALQGDFDAIPALAKGGIIRHTPGGTIARVGEGAHDEAVVPLDGTQFGTQFGTTVNNYTTLNVPVGYSDPVQWGRTKTQLEKRGYRP